MTRTQATEPASRHDAWRNSVIKTLGDFSELAARPWNQLRDIEIFPGCRLGSDEFVVPADYLPKGLSQRESFRKIDLAEAGVPSDPAAAAYRAECVRRAALACWLPRQKLTGVRRLGPSTWLGRVKLLLAVAAWQFEHLPSKDGSIFGAFTKTIVERDLLPALARSKQQRDEFKVLFDDLADAQRRTVISDWPDPEAYEGDGQEIIPGPLGRELPQRAEVSEPKSWQPFSDRFVTECVRRALWIQENIARHALDLWTSLRLIAADQAKLGRKTSHPSVIALRNEQIEKFTWKDKFGKPLERLPFKLTYTENGKTVELDRLPRTARDVNRLISTIQALNFSIVDFCTGARASELCAAEDSELQTSDGRLHSTTFKMVDSIGGQERDWPLHPAAVQALWNQQMLVAMVRREGQKHVWVILNGNKIGQPLHNLTEPLVHAVDHLGLSHLTGEDRAHVHRWRHTVGRLIALSVVGAPQVLLDLFGHRDLEMTLRYMMSDPQIVEDAHRIAREASYLMAEEAVLETVAGLSGGPAAEPLRQGLTSAAMRRGEEEFDVKDLRQAVDVLTFNHRFWTLVRPGVICTKVLGQFGPCTKDWGSPDPGACRTSCEYRLETSRAKRDCEEAIDQLIVERQHADAQGEPMLVANLDGQILSQLKRWPDVRDRVLSQHPEIRPVWEAGL